MSLERRQALARLADEYELLVVEDDPYGAIRFAGSPLPAVASMSDRAAGEALTAEVDALVEATRASAAAATSHVEAAIR